MRALSNYFLARGTGRNVLIALGMVLFSIGMFNFVLTPQYQEVSSGFVPFDLQFPLTREMIIIQLGAMTESSFDAYTRFAMFDMAFPIVGAAALILLWAWLVQKSDSAVVIGIYRRGWWIWAVFPALCDLSENILFLQIIGAHPEPALQAIEWAVDVHRGKLVFLSIAQGISVALILLTIILRLRDAVRS
jgi:hypothetical protein